MVSIIIDESFSMGIWCKKMLSVLTSQLKNKRICYESVFNAVDMSPGVEYAYLVGADSLWAKYSISVCNKKGVHPILLCNRAYMTISDNIYSQVCTDIMGSMFELVKALRETGHNKLGLYGINRLSISDMSLLNGYLATADEDSRSRVIYNEGSFEKCYEDFMTECKEVDGVICANDFLGISLVRHLKEHHPERLNRLTVISNTDLQLTQLYSDVLIAVKHHTAEYGKAAVMMLETLQKNTYLSGMTMSLKWDCGAIYRRFGKEAEKAYNPGAFGGTPLPDRDKFYSDRELQEMMTIEQILFESDETDVIIVKALLEGKSYETIAEENFLAINTVKYHIKKMLGICGFEKKKELVRLLQKYIPD